ncbi:MAG: XRE family transcriptional regulator [Thermodesulfobacteriota bacterium]
MIEQQIAQKIRKIRESKGLTQEALGKKIGVSKALLSKIENNQSSPPIATLAKIAQGLGVSISLFFIDDGLKPKDYTVIRKEERKQIVRPGSKIGFTYFSLSGLRNSHLLDAFIIRYPKVEKEPKVLFDHEGEELVFALRGEVEFVYGDERIRLKPGDAVHFDSSQPHRAQNALDEESECLVVVVSKK